MMKKILKALSLVMVLVMCFTMVFTTAVSAEGTDTLTLSVDNAAPKAGETVNITVTSNFTTVAGAHFAIDLAGLEYVSVDGDYAEYFSAETMNFVKEFNEDNGNLVESGDLFVITATVPADAEVGTVYNVGFGTIAASKEFCDYNLNEVTVTKTGVDVTVAADEPPVYEDANLKLASYGITMANGFALDFKVNKTMETSLGYSDIYVVFKKPRYDAAGNVTNVEETVVTAAERTDDPTNSARWIYTLNGVQPQELATVVSATIYGTKDGNVYTGATAEKGVLDYVASQLKSLTSTSTASNIQVACADMVNFAAAVQSYAGYNTANPIIDAANSKIGNEVWQQFATQEITRELPNDQVNTPFDGETNVRIRSIGVTLDSKVVLFFKCANTGVTTLANPENYKLHVKYEATNGDTNEFDVSIAGAEDEFKANVDTLFSTELGTVVTVYMVDLEGNKVSNTVEYSIETYLAKKLTDANEGAWATALVKYGDSVRRYAGLDK